MYMKTPMIMAAAALIVAGCDRPQTADNASVDQTKDSIQKSAREAKNAVEKEAESKKDMLEAEAKSAQAKLEADAARLKSAGAEAQGKVEAATDNIRNAGAAGARTQTEIGTSPTPVTPPTPTPAEPATTTPVPTPTPNLSAAPEDQKLAEQVRTIIAPAGADAAATPAVQVMAAGGVVTLKGTVKSDAEKSRIETAAKAVSGVTRVDNQIEVKSE
jgi:hyperosmotically inducible periplasmic protein